METIEFISLKKLENTLFNVVPSSQAIPEWFKDTPIYNGNIETIKKCPGINDMFRSGYIVMNKNNIKIHVDYLNGIATVDRRESCSLPNHDVRQFDKCPHHNKLSAFKLSWDFLIKSPEGTSCLFLDPFLHKHPDFVVSEAIIDTDTFHLASNLIFLCNSKVDFIIPANTPLLHIFPFKRVEWKMEIKEASLEEASNYHYFNESAHDKNIKKRNSNHYYKHFHSKKVFR